MTRKLLYLLLAILLGLAALIGFAVGTETGLRWTFAGAVRVLPGDLSANVLHGRLTGPLEIEGLVYRDGDTHIALEHLALDWHPSALLSGTLNITRLRAADLRVRLPAKQEPAPPEPPQLRLPLKPALEDTLITGIVIDREGPAEPILIERVRLDSHLDGDTLRIAVLSMDAPSFQVQAQGSVGMQRPHPLALDIEWSTQVPEYRPFRGGGRIEGNLERLTAVQNLIAPITGRFDATLYEPLGRLRWEATLELPATTPEALRPDWPAIPVSGRIEAEGDRTGLRAAGNADVRHPKTGPIHATFRTTRQADRWTVDSMKLALAGTGARLSAKGQVITGGTEPRVALEGSWQDLAWPLAAPPALESAQGSFSVQGTPRSYRLILNARLGGPEIPSGEWTLAAEGGRAGLAVTNLRGDVLSGVLEGAGSLDWSPRLAWSFNIEGRNLNPAAAWPEWPGNIAFSAATEGAMRNGAPDASAEITRVAGKLRGYPLDARSRLEVAGDRYRLDALEFHSGTARLRASGTLAETWALDWEVDAPDLAALLPAGGGTITGRGKVRGPRHAPRFDATVNGANLRARDYRLAQLKGALSVGLQDQEPSRIELDVQDLRLGPRTVQSARFRTRGTPAAHEFSLSAQAPGAGIEVRGSGAFGENLWRGRFAQADLLTAQYGRWILQDPLALRVGRAEAVAEPSCWGHREARACAGGEWRRDRGWRANMELDALPLALFQPLLPPQTALTGTLDGTATAARSAEGVLTLQATLTPGPGTLRYVRETDEPATVAFRDARLEAEAGADGLRTRLTAAMGTASRIDSVVELPRFNDAGVPFPQQPLAGRVQLAIHELGLIPAFVPAAEGVSGTVEVDLALGGVLNAPRVTGRAVLANGTADVPRLGVRLQDIRLEARDDGPDALQFSGSAQSGDGTVRIDGRVALDAARGWPLEATVEGEHFLAVNTAEARIWISPELQVRTQGTRAVVEGIVRVPEAKLTRVPKPKVVQASPDVVIVNGAGRAEEESARRRIESRIRIILGDQVQFSGFGVKGRVVGELAVTEEAGKPPTGSGELQIVDGVYEAYGQELKIERGRLIFAASPIDNPALDVRAVRRIGDEGELLETDQVVAGIQVRGRVKSPEISLFSEPSLPESEILSYLLLGQPLTQASATEGELLTDAAGSLGIKGGELLAKRLGAAFGIEDIRVEEGATPAEAALVLGTYLSPRLYVGYGVGLAESVNSLRIRYQLSRRWILQTRTGAQSGADLLYTIER